MIKTLAGLFLLMIGVVALGDESAKALPRAVVPMTEFWTDSPPAGLAGYCPVSLVEFARWRRGNNHYRAEYLDRTYFFATDTLRRKFMDAPDKYAPVASGNDVVAIADEDVPAKGRHQHGVFYRGHVFLFRDESNLKKFWASPETYSAPHISQTPNGEDPQQNKPTRTGPEPETVDSLLGLENSTPPLIERLLQISD